MVFQSKILSSYIKLPKELNHPKKGLINIQIIGDNECFQWCLVRQLHPAVRNPRRITKDGKLFGDKLNFQDMKFFVKIKDTHKIKK